MYFKATPLLFEEIPQRLPKLICLIVSNCRFCSSFGCINLLGLSHFSLTVVLNDPWATHLLLIFYLRQVIDSYGLVQGNVYNT